jgi:hypothetical protein
MNKLGLIFSVPWPRRSRLEVVEARLEPICPKFYRLPAKESFSLKKFSVPGMTNTL